MLQTTKITEPIPGYVVKERIGVGGYGEVWSASAPGGLTKAIKFVYGYFDDARASRELKALDRIKQVRHPFLLSLERFEVVEGQLVIVTELADMSLKDRFEALKTSGQIGIPREELLRYMRDAADALDYMSENFSLQHLDVKPENMLLVGGRVKVADFGLVKDLHDATASLMGGLTPIYAAPEVFDDRPSQRSDQYSLAIVYQEMLTGNLPFPGRTSAQLASQHLHARPKLTGLSDSDQAVIAQALAKDPRARFENCAAMIEALIKGRNEQRGSTPERSRTPVSSASDTKSNRALAGRADTDARPAGPNGVKTQVLGQRPERGTDSVPRGQTPPPPPVARHTIQLPPLESLAQDQAFRPTLFVGIGGTATRTLRRLRRRLRDRSGAEAIPSLALLALDTDAKSLYQATQGDSASVLHDNETLSLPLRNAHDYTRDSRQILEWLSRRWLYNIPRSLQTEGRRPLGRLAMVDHGARIFERIRTALADILSPEAVEASAKATGWEVNASAPRVFVLASISGGTGGGMAIDLGYVVRQILSDLELSDDGVVGILTHSTDRNPAASDLAKANAYATLSELQHYVTSGRYPGEPAFGVAAHSGSQGAFPSTYLVHLGEDLSDVEFDAAADALASYLCHSTVSPARGLFDQCRREPSTVEPGATSDALVRSFGLATLANTQTALVELAVNQVSKEVVDRWRGAAKVVAIEDSKESFIDQAAHANDKEQPVVDDRVEQTAAAHAAEQHLDLEALREQMIAVIERELGSDVDTVFAKLRGPTDRPPAPGQVGQMLHTLSSLFGPSPGDENAAKGPLTPLQLAIERDVKQLAAPKGEAIRDWLLGLVEDPASRVGAAVRAKDWYAAHIRALDASTTELLQSAKQAIQALEQILRDSEQPQARGKVFARRAEKGPADLEEAVRHLVELRFYESAEQGLRKLLRLVSVQVSGAGEQLKDLQRELGQLAREFSSHSTWDEAAGQAPTLKVFEAAQAAISRSLRDRIPQLSNQVDARLQNEFLTERGGLRIISQQPDAVRRSLSATLSHAARTAVLGALHELNIADVVLSNELSGDARAERLASAVEAARPQLASCGGAQRLIAILPQEEAETGLANALRTELQPGANVVTDTSAELVLCAEAQDLPVPTVAARIIDGRADFARIAARLHTRTDVTWTTLE